MISVVEQASALIFDFDGTLVDSNPIKRQAFRRCFEDFPNHLGQILDYCYANNHIPRWEKFRYVYEKLLKLPYTDQVESNLLRRFELETTEQIIAAPALPGAEEFLKRACITHSLGILSSTPQEILLEILRRRGWVNLFEWIQGAPVHKARWLTRFQLEQGFPGHQVLFFGDTPEDEQSAQESGCSFVRISDQDQFLEMLK